MSMKSEGAGTVLRMFLWVSLFLGVLQLLLITIYIVDIDASWQTYQSVDIAVALFQFFVYIILLIMYMVWMYRIHGDLRRLDSSYAISPGGAMARIFIPIYNIWGVWNIHSQLAKYLKQFGESTMRYGASLSAWFPLFYITFIANSYFNRMVIRDEFVSDTILLLAYGTDVLMKIFAFVVITLIMKGIRTVVEERKRQGLDKEGLGSHTSDGEPNEQVNVTSSPTQML